MARQVIITGDVALPSNRPGPDQPDRRRLRRQRRPGRRAADRARGRRAPTWWSSPSWRSAATRPRDLLDLPEFVDAAAAALAELAAPAEWSRGLALVVGFPERVRGGAAARPGQRRRPDRGRARGRRRRKTLLPTYDVFDETRYFLPAAPHRRRRCPGWPARSASPSARTSGTTSAFWQRPRYERDPIAELAARRGRADRQPLRLPLRAGQAGAARADARGQRRRPRRAHRLRQPGGRQRRARLRRRLDARGAGRPRAGARPALRGGAAGGRPRRRAPRGRGARRPPRPAAPDAAGRARPTSSSARSSWACATTSASAASASAVLGLSGGIDSALAAVPGRRRPRAGRTCWAWPCPRRYSCGHSLDDARGARRRRSASASSSIPIEPMHAAFAGAAPGGHLAGRPARPGRARTSRRASAARS